MNHPPNVPNLQPRRLVRWALMIPLAISVWVVWQLLLARLFYGGTFQAGLSWTEGTAEAMFILVAAFIAPARKRTVAAGALLFFVVRNLATVLFSAGTVAPENAALGTAMAALAAAVVWRYAPA